MNASKFARALRQRFPGPLGPRAALRALGLDADLLAPGGGGGGGDADAIKALRVDLELLLGELNLDETQIGRILELLDQHAPLDRLSDSDPNAGRARELAGDDQLENFRAVLVAAGMSEADVAEAARLASGGATGRLGTDSAARARTFAERHPEAARIQSI
jgi:hypothetical protein